MAVPDYRMFLRAHMEDTTYADALNESAAVLTDVRDLARRADNDPSQLNTVIDAVLDEFIAAADKDVRLALFGALCAYGAAMQNFLGPRPGRQAPPEFGRG